MYYSAQRAEKKIIALTPGGRPVYAMAYGEKNRVRGEANYSSALGAGNPSYFADPATKRPVLLLIGAVHGQETEGVAAIANLVSLLETGKDLAGRENQALLALCEKARVVIVPVANPDGRARVVPESMLGVKGAELRYWGQGTWKDGSLCGWPECKKVHPIRSAAGFLGGYYNDDGVNLMHDNFFCPMARETTALLRLAEDEQADLALHLHGGSNSQGDLLLPAYMSTAANRTIETLAEKCRAAGALEGLTFRDAVSKKTDDGIKTPPSFNLPSAMHHICGAANCTYESNECIIDEPGPHLTHEQVLRMHMILFEQALGILCKV